MGHVHPVFSKPGSVVNGERVWIHIQARKELLFPQKGLIDIVVIPSFNPTGYGFGVRKHSKSISPIISRVMGTRGGIANCIVATLDGSVVGDALALKNIL
jgi:metallophosphoesterase superfamily enzyme